MVPQRTLCAGTEHRLCAGAAAPAGPGAARQGPRGPGGGGTAERDTVDVVFDRPAADDAEYRDDLRQALGCLHRYDATLVSLRTELDHALATPFLGQRRAAFTRARAVAGLRGRESAARRRMA